MKPSELAYRGRQQVSKMIERVMAPNGASPPLCRFDRKRCSTELWQIIRRLDGAERDRAAVELQRAMDLLLSSRFFAGASDEGVVNSINAHCAADRAEIVERAEEVCRDEFEILGYGAIWYGSPVNWQFDPISEMEVRPQHWSRIDHLATKDVGDSKVVFELNRHQWMLDLGQAYRFTCKPRYARSFVRQIEHWMQQNPPGFGINWTSSLEVAFRMISWCWALFFFRNAPELTPKLFVKMLGWLQAHALYVERYLSEYYSPNTHLTGEALGLFYAGVLFQELQGSKRWRELGERLLVEQMTRQVHADGVHFEQSTRYQFYTVEIYLHYLLLAQRNQLALPEIIGQRLREMMEFLLHVRRPDGTIPQIGDTDGGWLLPLVRRKPGDFQSLFSTAAIVFQDSELAWAARLMTVEALWLLGAEGQRSWSSLKQTPPQQALCHNFDAGGYVVMRSGWSEQSHHLIFDTGPLGCRVSGAHGHADLLSIQCCAWGESYLVDAGTFCYTADPFWRNYFRSSQAHSTVLVEGRSQAEPNGPFSWKQRPAVRLRKCDSAAGFCLADAEHDAYTFRNQAVTHRRRLLFVDSSYWLVIDDVSGSEAHRVEARFQFAPLLLDVEANDWVRARGENSSLLLKSFSATPMTSRIQRGETEPPAGWISPNYGERIAAPVLTFSTEGPLPLRIVTLIYPLRDREGAPFNVVPLVQQSRVLGLELQTDKSTFIRIDDDDVSLTTPPESAHVRH